MLRQKKCSHKTKCADDVDFISKDDIELNIDEKSLAFFRPTAKKNFQLMVQMVNGRKAKN